LQILATCQKFAEGRGWNQGEGHIFFQLSKKGGSEKTRPDLSIYLIQIYRNIGEGQDISIFCYREGSIFPVTPFKTSTAPPPPNLTNTDLNDVFENMVKSDNPQYSVVLRTLEQPYYTGYQQRLHETDIFCSCAGCTKLG